MRVVRYLDAGDIDFAALIIDRDLIVGGRKPRRRTYIDLLTAFDIETTTVDIDGTPHAFMYHWQFCLLECGLVVTGRSWEEFNAFVFEMTSWMSDGLKIVCLVHNLAYEFQYLSGIMRFETDDVFAISTRIILKAASEHLEFRCSYRHSNMGLADYCKRWNVPHQKLEMDYKKQRYPWTELSAEETAYCVNDVIGLCEAYKREMEYNRDNLVTTPLTSTGYIRRMVRYAMNKHYLWLKYQVPDLETFKLLEAAFRGGDTHASRFYSCMVLHNVSSYDRSSSYPDVLCNCPFPVTKFQPVHPSLFPGFDFDKWRQAGKAFVFRARFDRLRLRDKHIPYPYLSFSKCEEFSFGDYRLDNGRVLNAGYVVTTMTDVDFMIFRDCYEWDSMRIQEMQFATYGQLPDDFKEMVINLYKQKTALKHSEDPDEKLLYEKVKALINSLYGLLAQNPLKQSIVFDEDDEDLYRIDDSMSESERLDDFYKHPYGVYQHGVWCTAWARYRLWELFQCVGWENLVYWDTDSVKFVGDADFSVYNECRISDSRHSGGYGPDKNGVTHYMGVVEQDGFYDEFKTLGAKKYVYRSNGTLGITIAGVEKKKGAEELEKAGGVEAFKEDLTFEDSGGKMLVYNDHDDYWTTVDGHELHIGRNVAIVQDSYTVHTTSDYKLLLKTAQEMEENIYPGVDYYDEGVL